MVLANVVLAKSTTTTLVAPGVAITYTLTATNTVAGTTRAAGYTFQEVVPANTTFTSISGGMTTDCTAGAVAGTLCTITVTNAIVAGTAQTASFHGDAGGVAAGGHDGDREPGVLRDGADELLVDGHAGVRSESAERLHGNESDGLHAAGELHGE